MKISKNKNIIALIPARGGSKSIPKKNIMDLAGHPLIAYSIAAVRLSKYISRIIVSTDNQEIAKISEFYGAEVPFVRPQKYATDASRDIGFIKHAINWLKRNEGFCPDYIVFLRPTTPLRDIKVVDKAILEIIKDKKATSLRSAHKFESSAYKLFRKKGSYAEFFGKEDFRPSIEYQDLPRQKLPATYKTNGYVDILLTKFIEKTGKLHGPRIKAFVTNETADIDTLRDVDFARAILKNKEYLPLVTLLNKIKQKYGKKF
ncbi:MAG: acylneuraminate cytidylyltransferase family protein [Candidatus Staskawiczbacteria bacterium]|nr:acylneuraminate cytidylyltransferase family protein [Candidatus Staskawiczbacteria bacterium]